MLAVTALAGGILTVHRRVHPDPRTQERRGDRPRWRAGHARTWKVLVSPLLIMFSGFFIGYFLHRTI
ncbi:MAG: hypothetical protein M3022_00690 [Actinomycetota bacterium]|nr:hypothetical protein [Actinomycetota bacterium]